MYLYLETSVWNMLVDDDPVNAEKRRDTELLLNEAKSGKHELYVSDLVIKEINADRNPSHRSMLLDAVAVAGPVVLAERDEVLTLANTYVSSGIVPTRYIADGLHIAYAVSNALDAVISWNMRHIVKVRTRREIRVYNEANGLNVPDLGTPSEVIDRE